MDTMTRADVFAKVREHFSKPDAELAWQDPSYIGDYDYTGDGEEDQPGRCVYRGNQDEKSPVRCAVGCLIPDEYYRREWDDGDGTSATSIWTYIRNLFADDVNAEFLGTLQNVHDSIARRAYDEPDDPGSPAEFLVALDVFEKYNG